MTYEEFEWNILKLAYEDGLERFEPSYLAYALGLPHETVSNYLEQATHAGLIEMEVTDDGRLQYFVPGADAEASLPKPIWKDEIDSSGCPGPAVTNRAVGSAGELPAAQADSTDPLAASPNGTPAPRPGPDELSVDDPARHRVRAGDGETVEHVDVSASPKEEADAEQPTDGSVDGVGRGRALVPRKPPHGSALPAELRAHIEQRYGSEDGSVTEQSPPGQVAVLDREATVNDADDVHADKQLVTVDDPPRLPLRIESGADTFTDPSQTIFMRQLTVYGVRSEDALREHVERLFTSFGYQTVHADRDRLHFERGSVTFILALVPLFVLVLPLFVYLFLYCMGRSTIQQEPVELDVQFRKLGDEQGTYEIDLTFIGMHGVVLGAADQRVLNKEVDLLSDELQWALSAG